MNERICMRSVLRVENIIRCINGKVGGELRTLCSKFTHQKKKLYLCWLIKTENHGEY